MEEVEIPSIVVLNGNPQQKTDTEFSSSTNPKVSLFGLFAFADTFDYFLMFLATIGSIIHGAALPLFFVFFGRLINSLDSIAKDPHRLTSEISQEALHFVYLGVLVFASAWMGIAFWMQTGERQAACLRLKYLQSVLKRDIDFFDREARDENIIFCISSDAILVQDAIGDKTGHALRYLAQFCVGIVIGFTTVWQLSLVILAVVPLIVIAGGGYAIIMSTLSRKGEAAYAEAGKDAEEIISQVRTVYSFVGEDKAIEKYSRSLTKALNLGKKSGIVKGVGIGSIYGLLFCSWALLLWYASILVRHRDTDGGKAFSTILNVIFSGLALGQAAPSLGAIGKGRAATSNIISMIQTDSSSSQQMDNGIILPDVSGKIEFSEVSFSYPSRPNKVFEDLSFTIHAGQNFALVGQSGSGKSTIISMMERFYDPTSGKILLDGHDLKSLQLKWLRKQMGLVNQEPALFAMSIAGNIMYGKVDAEMEQIIEASKAANAHSFIQGLPDGYHTQVGEGGAQLSGGQKQRISIARAVLRNPKILLLDEATSALDTESELIVQQALNKIMSERTTIIVAHRLSTIRDVNKIIVLKNGKIVESGTHIELMSKGADGEYANLVNLQKLGNIENPSKGSWIESSGTSTISEIPRMQIHHQRTMSIDRKGLHMVKQELAPTPSIWKLVKLNAPEWPYALLGSVGAVLAGMEAPLFAFGITHMLAVYTSDDDLHIKHEVRRVCLIMIGVGAITVPIYLLQHYFYTLMGEQITSRIRFLMFSAILRNEIGWFDLDENSTGSLTTSLAVDATLVRAAIADRLSTILQNVALTVTAFAISFTLSWRLAAVMVATYPFLISSSLAEQLFLRGFGGDYNRAYSQDIVVVREAITNIRTVAAFGAEDHVVRQFIHELSQSKKQSLLRGHISGVCYGLTLFFAFCSYALALWYASLLIKHKHSSFGDVIKCFMVLLVTAFSIAETFALAPQVVKGSQALGSVFNILQRETAIDANSSTSEAVTQVNGLIEFRNVSFKYPTRPDILVLDDFNLQVPSGCSLALVGQSGSGKSSVISLILRFYDPISGVILIDGRDIRGLNLKGLRMKMGLVQQEPALFSTTIYENIKYGKENASEIEIMNAAKAANAHGFISRMPDGYQTHVGERGIQLSGGQKQRVAIARAILKDPAILLLDEATSALDTASERVVQEALDRLMEGRTTILVAHRLSTIHNADNIAVLKHGKVVETGSHETLILRPDSVYAQLINIQLQNGVA
ncbi:PREDICTED: ABC transporter B family member 13-like [Nelumbo nucifera]|uniref:ABC transporter B family member 13-like n=2 Tax=Nelumbo nucifera TaxID=4432 RepID=A0A1U8AI30_NELNU|nr:PREDICTED: ABC transporter B family member 13-like [Nelumbo nucifera]DAD46772.1 TPA_asm: hypothetical protein HUJ06_016709 [Nelumbo nucifera]